MKEIINSLSPIERIVLQFFNQDINEIIKKSKKDKTTILRALSLLEKKGIIELKEHKNERITLGVNGVRYVKNHLPERTLLITIDQNNYKTLNEIKEISKLSEDEFKASLGILKRLSLIEIKNGKMSISTTKDKIIQKFPQEVLIEKLPIEKSKLTKEEDKTLRNLRERKDIIEVEEEKSYNISVTDKGKSLIGKEIKIDLLEEVTPEMIKNAPKKMIFRVYDLEAPVPKINSGKSHFVNESIEDGKKIWLEMGFKEMSGSYTTTSFWNFDALFTPQDHPVREMQDTFFIKSIGDLPKNNLVNDVKKAHEQGLGGSKGWNYKWEESESKKVVLRTHTTCLSAKKLSEIKLEDLPAKYFSIGKVFRNETVDWSHGFEFNQSEGIVVDPNANFRHLIGYLKEFYKKMGFEKIRITPAYFPYTEPSLEIHAFHPEKKEWLELGGAGIFRPEVTIPLIGKNIPVLAWGPGFDRIMMMAHKIQDLRNLYKNDIKYLRNKNKIIK